MLLTSRALCILAQSHHIHRRPRSKGAILAHLTLYLFSSVRWAKCVPIHPSWKKTAHPKFVTYSGLGTNPRLRMIFILLAVNGNTHLSHLSHHNTRPLPGLIKIIQ